MLFEALLDAALELGWEEAGCCVGCGGRSRCGEEGMELISGAMWMSGSLALALAWYDETRSKLTRSVIRSHFTKEQVVVSGSDRMHEHTHIYTRSHTRKQPRHNRPR